MHSVANYLIIHKDSPINIGGANSGAETATLALAEYLAKLGKRVVVAGQIEGEVSELAGIEFWDLGESFDVVAAAERARELGEYHLISAGRAIPFFVFRNELQCKSKILISHDRSGNDTGVKPQVLSTLVERVVCVSNAQASVLHADGLPQELTSVIHNGVNLDLFPAGAPEERDWQKLVFSGALIQDKGIHVLLEAYSHLKAKYAGLSLDVFGSASLWGREEMFDSAQLEAQLPGVRFHGRVPQAVIAEGFRRAGICIVPSIWFDPFPLTSLEAQVSGCPVVAFDQGGLREGIRHEETGLVVQDVSVEALITALDQLLSNPQRLAQMSQAALQWARDYFNWERVAREITTLCDTLAATTSFVTTGAEGAPNLARQVGVERDSNSLGCRTGSITKDALVCNQEIPKISVITVCYNHGEFIRDAIESVLAQDYPNLEHIVIDGGSSDQTVSILSEYKHLNWISEPDRGQSHALNKGFERASGDIIAWLNSDDWYAKGAFEAVVPALQAHPIVMGACQLTDRVGVPGEIVDNIPRDWFDILKYWVFNSIPAQPSIFFTRNLLEAVRLPNGDYLEEDLHYCMDYELWLRMAMFAEFSEWVPQVLSYYRNYETNKTGGNMDAVYREMGEVYRRYSNVICRSARTFSVVVPVECEDSYLPQLLQQLGQQLQPDVEVVVVDYAAEKERSRAISRQVLELGSAVKPIGLRYVRCLQNDFFAALKQGLMAACAPNLVYLRPGSSIQPNFLARAQRLLQNDHLAILLPTEVDWQSGDHIAVNEDGSFRIESIFCWPNLLQSFVARKVALLELDVFGNEDNTFLPFAAFRALLLRTIHRGWQVYCDSELQVGGGAPLFESELPLLKQYERFTNAKLVTECQAEYESNQFARLRAKNGFCLVFPEELVSSQREILSTVPNNWTMSPLRD